MQVVHSFECDFVTEHKCWPKAMCYILSDLLLVCKRKAEQSLSAKVRPLSLTAP